MRFCPICKFHLDLEKTVEGEEGMGFLFCKSCNFKTLIEDDLLLLEFQRKAGELAVTTLDPIASLYDNFPRKQLESCTNKGCSSKNKRSIEVVVWKDENFNVRYICSECANVMKP